MQEIALRFLLEMALWPVEYCGSGGQLPGVGMSNIKTVKRSIAKKKEQKKESMYTQQCLSQGKTGL